MKKFFIIFNRQIKIYYNHISEALYPVLFDVGIVTIFGFITNFMDCNLAFKISFLLLIQFLSVMLNARFIVADDYKNGVFKEFLTFGLGIELCLFAKYKAHLLASSLMLILKLPIITYMLNIDLTYRLFFIVLLHLALMISLVTFSESMLVNVRNKMLSVIVTIPMAFACTLLSTLAMNVTAYILLYFGCAILIMSVLFLISVFALNISIEEGE